MNSELSDTLINILITILVAILPILGAMLVAYLRKVNQRIKADTTTTQYLLLQDLAALAVSAADQLYDGNKDKLAYARKQLLQGASDYGITITEEQTRLIIEGVLKGVKQGLSNDN